MASTPQTPMKVWIEGRIVDAEDARLSVLDHGLLYGDGVFEGLRIREGRVFRLDAHLERFGASARALGLELPADGPVLENIVLEVGRAIGAPELYLRLLATRGTGPLGVDPTRCRTPQILCIGGELALYPPEVATRGLDLATVSVRRDPAAAVDPRVKSLNYLGSVLAKREAILRGVDEALLLNPAGGVAEAAVANVFAVRGGVLQTPPATDGALEGITRDTVLELATAKGIPTRIASLGRMDLFRADEVFLCGTGVGLVPVRSLDGQAVGRERALFATLEAAYGERSRWDGLPIWPGADEALA